MLVRAGLASMVCDDVHALCRAIGDDLGAVLIAEEALRPAASAQLLACLGGQPSWSDLPIVVLTGEGELSHRIAPLLGSFVERTNATLLERPIRVATLVTALRTALRARRRQLDVRDHLAERSRSESALRESESRLRAAIESAPYPIMLYAGDGEVLQLNRAWTTLTGYDASKLRRTSDWVPHFRLASSPDGTPALVPGEWTVFTAGGAPRAWEVDVAPLAPLPDGRSLHLAAAVDVTAHRQLLERERHARDLAEQANRAKADFLAMMSHELRTPLNAIAGYAQLLSLGVRGPVTTEQRADLERIERSQRHLLSLINDILNFAKVEAGHVAIDVRAVPIAEILRDVQTLVAPQIRAKALVYVDDCETVGTPVLADAEKARQIVLNLLSNAVKFTPRAGRITVHCAIAERTATISVTDTGMGIAEEKQAEIFEPFIQVERHFTATHDGTGLGLSISRDLARRMGGELAVSSRLGTGSTFTLTLRRAEDAAAPHAP